MLANKSNSATGKIQTLENKKKSLQQSLKVAQSNLVERDIKLANTTVQLNNAKSKITLPDQQTKETEKAGWVYLGEYDKDNGNWLKRYVNVGFATSPNSLVRKSLQVTANALNVRGTGDPWANLIGTLKSGDTFQVSKIEEWGSTGYYWARITYHQ